MKQKVEQTEAVLVEEILYVVFKRKFLIVALLVIAGGIFMYGLLTDVDAYRAEAVVMIRRLPLGYQMPAESEAILRRGEVVNTEVEIIRSPAVAELIVERLDLGGEGDRARAVHSINRQIRAEAEPESNIIKISFAHTDPEVAARVTNAALDAYLTVRARVSFDYGAVNFLEQQSAKLKAQRDSVGAAIASYGAGGRLNTDGGRSHQHLGLIARFENDMATFDQSIDSRKAKIRLAEEWLASEGSVAHVPTDDIYGESTVRAAKLRHLDLETDLEKARARYAPEHPEVLRMERLVAGSEQIVRSEVEQALLRQRMRVDELSAEKRATQKMLDDLHALDAEVSEEEVQLRLLEHDLSIRADLYAIVTDRREQFKITVATDPSLLNVGVVSRASVPVEPTTAGVNMKAVFAFFTLLFGLAFVFGIERLDQSLVRRVDVEREMGLKVLASVRMRARR